MRCKTKKSIVSFCLFVLIFCRVAAEELYPADRFFGYGIQADAGVFNNSIFLLDIAQNLSELSLNDVLKQIPGTQFTFGGDADAKFFVGLNFPKWRFKLNIGAEANGILAIDKDLFKIQNIKAQNLANLDTGKTDAYADLFFYTDFTVSFPIKETVRLAITPGIFAPLFHVSVRDLYGNFSNNNNVLHLRLKSDAEFYNSLSDFISSNDTNNDMTSTPGFDLAATFEMPLPVPDLQIGGYIRLPLVPGSMSNGTTAYVDYDKTLDLNNYYAEEMATLIADFVRELTRNVTSNSNKLFIWRPFKMGAEISYKMFGDLLRFRGLLGLGVRYPYTKKTRVYPEYSLGVSVFGWKTIGVYASSLYKNQVFKQEIGTFINAKFIEFHLAVSGQSTNFIKSFAGNGLGVKFFLAFGVPMYADLF